MTPTETPVNVDELKVDEPRAPANASSRWEGLAKWSARVAAVTLGLLITLFAVFGIFYFRYSRLIDARLQAGAFGDSVNVYAAPLLITPGDGLSAADLGADLQAAGYEQSSNGKPGSWRTSADGLRIFPKSDAATPELTVHFADNRVTKIQSAGKDVAQGNLGSPLVTTLSPGKEQRMMVTYREIPPVLVHALISAEDKRFFEHRGVDLVRMFKAAYVDLKDHRKQEGASTLTMQLVRGLWLEPDKKWKRKVAETMMTMHVERQWSKEKILATYANQVYLGRDAAYSIHGFAEGARLFFGTDLRDISLSEAATLAGLVQRPGYLNPFTHPERARDRRDVVLQMMRTNHYITAAQYRGAINEPMAISGGTLKASAAPYFLDLVDEEVEARQADDASRDIYTTLDLQLQRAADAAVATGLKEVDKLLAKRYSKGGPKAEAALIAIDPHTGEIKAIVGGRDYARSQLNRVLAKRPPGSVFKPFVYAAALNTAITRATPLFTLANTVDDSPTTFSFGGGSYAPGNFHHESFGVLTLREALAKSDNVAAVKVAQGVGYKAVVRMAREAGLNNAIAPTPAVALGTYVVTPLEMIGAYTVFANGGRLVQPGITPGGSGANSRQALDPRVAWLMVSMLQDVMRSGTAAGVRSRGFTAPAAGKTGTSHDGWFAGFTSQLLCLVWVGFDDYRELGLEGAKSALPIWTEFMKSAIKIAPYRNATEFPMPGGVSQARICLDSGKLAGDFCDNVRKEFFVAGSEPSEKCDLHGAPSVEPAAGSIDTIAEQ